MRTDGAVKVVTIFGMLLAGVAYAQGNHWQALKQTAEATDASGDRLLTQLEELQSRTMSILEKARFNGDLHTALGAVAEARANLELMAVLGGRLPVREAAGSGGPAVVYLIAFKDHVIRAAMGYGVEGTTLFFTTPQGTREQVPLDAIDVPFSEQLNRERGVEFRLAPK